MLSDTQNNTMNWDERQNSIIQYSKNVLIHKYCPGEQILLTDLNAKGHCISTTEQNKERTRETHHKKRVIASYTKSKGTCQSERAVAARQCIP